MPTTLTKPLKIGLFSLTGMGNSVLRALCEADMPPAFVVTREEVDAFPYYSEKNLAEYAADLNIPCYAPKEGEAYAAQLELDVLLVATYHRIINDETARTARLSLNIHPSLLPKYPGPNPFFAVLANGEGKTGITIHELVQKIDGGDIFWQESLSIANQETQGTLRKRLSDLAGKSIIALLNELCDHPIHPTPQPPGHWKTAPKPNEEARTIDPSSDVESIARQVRALSPYPGALVQGIGVSRILDIKRGCAPNNTVGDITECMDDKLELQTREGIILFERLTTEKD